MGKKNLKYKFKRKDIYIRKKKQNPIYYPSAKNEKKNFKKKYGEKILKYKVSRICGQEKNQKFKFKRNDIFIRKTKIKSKRFYFFKN